MLASVVALISVIGVIDTIRSGKAAKTERKALMSNASAYYVEDYRADNRCDICFDSMGDERVCECSCGKVFHRSCAEPTGSCPYCGTEFDKFPVTSREPRAVTCFRCGKTVERNICECGTVIPYKDHTFSCHCGEVLSEDSIWCPNCGRTFERRTALADKTLFPKW